MTRFLLDVGGTSEQCAMVVAKNKANAMANPAAAYPARMLG